MGADCGCAFCAGENDGGSVLAPRCAVSVSGTSVSDTTPEVHYRFVVDHDSNRCSNFAPINKVLFERFGYSGEPFVTESSRLNLVLR